MSRDPLESEIYKLRNHVEAATVAILTASRMVPPRLRNKLIKTLMIEINEIPIDVDRGGSPARLPVRELLTRLGIRRVQ